MFWALPKTKKSHCIFQPMFALSFFPLTAKVFDDELNIELAGIKIFLKHAPGETPDQICVWLPDKKVLIVGDNYYHAFPNLYAIRGYNTFLSFLNSFRTRYRDVLTWAMSLDMLAKFNAEYLVPCHTEPVYQ